jgi:hypothetical protein
MADGHGEPIDEVKLGDKVLATDPRSGATSAQPVTALQHNHDAQLADLVVTDGRGRIAILHTTQHHPFWDQTTGSWAEAGRLRVGESLYGSSGAMVIVLSVRTFVGDAQMYNLTVETVHTFYVFARTTPVLVHNSCPEGVSDVWHEGTFDSPEDSFRFHYEERHGLRAGVHTRAVPAGCEGLA